MNLSMKRRYSVLAVLSDFTSSQQFEKPAMSRILLIKMLYLLFIETTSKLKHVVANETVDFVK